MDRKGGQLVFLRYRANPVRILSVVFSVSLQMPQYPRLLQLIVQYPILYQMAYWILHTPQNARAGINLPRYYNCFLPTTVDTSKKMFHLDYAPLPIYSMATLAFFNIDHPPFRCICGSV